MPNDYYQCKVKRAIEFKNKKKIGTTSAALIESVYHSDIQNSAFFHFIAFLVEFLIQLFRLSKF